MLETIEIETAPNPTATVIWMHGLGADGNDFAPMVPELRLGSASAIRFVFPHAPMIPVTINNGYVMRAWYDISYGDLEGKSRQADEKGVRASQAEIEKLIAREVGRGIRANKIVIAGFSQGGAIALHRHHTVFKGKWHHCGQHIAAVGRGVHSLFVRLQLGE